MKTSALGLGLLLALGACDLGPDGPATGGALYTRIAGSDDGRLDTLGIICESSLTVTGTYDQTVPQPIDISGCWDVGVWTITSVAIEQQGCAPNPAASFLASYAYDVRRDDEDFADTSIFYLDDPDFDRVNLKISSAGDGLCHGSFTHFYTDNTVIALEPTLQLDGTLSGTGVFQYTIEDSF